MGLKAILDSLDNVPAELHDFYQEQDGKFVLDLEEDIKTHPRVSALSNAYRQEQSRRKELSTKVEELEGKVSGLPEDFDPDEWARLKQGEGAKPDEAIQLLKDQHEKKIASLMEKHAKDLASKDQALSERDGYIDRTTKLDTLRKSLREVGIDPDFEDAVVDHLSPSIKVQRLDDGNRKAIVETDMGELDVNAFVTDWAKTKGQKFLGKASGPDPKGNGSARSGGKVMTRTEFDKLDPAAKHKAMTVDKIQLVDA